MRGPHPGAAVRGQHLRRELVGHDEENVRSFRHRTRSGRLERRRSFTAPIGAARQSATGYEEAAARRGCGVECPMAKSFFAQTSRPRASQIGLSEKFEG